MPAVPFAGQASASLHGFGGVLSSYSEHNDSSSPTLSDSGISVDAASSGSSARGIVATEAARNHHAFTSALNLSSSGPGMLLLFLTPVLLMGCSVSVVVGRRTSDREIASSVPGRCIAG